MATLESETGKFNPYVEVRARNGCLKLERPGRINSYFERFVVDPEWMCLPDNNVLVTEPMLWKSSRRVIGLIGYVASVPRDVLAEIVKGFKQAGGNQEEDVNGPELTNLAK
jgi:hypothetical protein